MSSTSASSPREAAAGSPLSNRLFALVWGGALISNIGNWMENSAQNWAVVSQLQHDPTRQAFLSELLNVADFAPALLLLLIAGVITDRVNLKRYLLLLQVLACLLGAGLAVVAYLKMATPWVVIGFTFAEGIVWALNGPPWQAVVPHLVPRSQLPKAVALNSAQFNLARLIGPVVAGIIIARFGVSAAFTVNALSYAVVIYALIQLPPQRPRNDGASAGPILADLTAGLKFVARHAGLRRLSLMLICFVFLAAPLQGLLAVYAQQVLHGDSRLYGLLLGAIGLGALAGALAVGRVPSYYPRHHLIPVSMCGAAGFIFLFTFTKVPVASGAVLVAVGFFWVVSLNSANAANQLLAMEGNRGRVISVMLLCNQGAMPLGHLCAAGLIHVMSPALVIRWMAAVLLVIGLYFLMRREPAIDEMKRQGMELSWLESFWEAVTAQSHRPVPQRVRGEIAQGPAAGTDMTRHG